MKYLFLLFALTIQTIAFSQTKITPADASKHIGDTVMVCGKIYGGKYFESGKSPVTFLNMGAAYPNSPMTVMVPQKVRAAMKSKPEEFYKDKNICVTGIVKEYKGKAEIVLRSADDIKIDEQPAGKK